MAAVLVHIDLDGDVPDASSLVALSAGRHVASSWGATLYAALIARDPGDHVAADSMSAAKIPGIGAIEDALGRGGADKVVVALTDAAVAPLWAAVGSAWQGVLDHLHPRLVLFGADSPSAAELAPRTGARIGARRLTRAQSLGIDDVELRDRDGGYVRSGDSGAVVAMIGRAEPPAAGDDDIDLVVLAVPSEGDVRVELVGSAPASATASATIVALGDDVANDRELVANAHRLAARLGARIVGGPAGALRGAVDPAAVIERSTALAPELCIAIGDAQLELAGASRLVMIGGNADRTADGALPGPVDVGLTSLLDKLEGK